MSDTVDLAIALIKRPSVTPEDSGCQDIIAERLDKLSFTVQHLPFGDVCNLWARHGDDKPLLVFAGHTDVVPTGNPASWRSDPFVPMIRDGFLYGRGAADMKGSLAAMITAAERFISKHPRVAGSLGFLITSDEEGPAEDGTVKVVEHLGRRAERIDWCLVGEPSSSKALGDTIKNGRRGSLNATLTIYGTQGHVAYPERAANPIHLANPALAKLCTETWDHGDDCFPPTSFQISNIHAGIGAENIIPAELEIKFNFRYSAALSARDLKNQVAAILDKHDLRYDLKWQLSGEPFVTKSGELLDAVRWAIRVVTGRDAQLSTAGGTSDGRFIAPTGAEVVELGPVNETIHKIDERVVVTDLDALSSIYEKILIKLLSTASMEPSISGEHT